MRRQTWSINRDVRGREEKTEELQNDSSYHPPTSDALVLGCILPPPSCNPFSRPSFPPFFPPHFIEAGTVTEGEIDWSSLWTRREAEWEGKRGGVGEDGEKE